jgi:hypothetical protein
MMVFVQALVFPGRLVWLGSGPEEVRLLDVEAVRGSGGRNATLAMAPRSHSIRTVVSLRPCQAECVVGCAEVGLFHWENRIICVDAGVKIRVEILVQHDSRAVRHGCEWTEGRSIYLIGRFVLDLKVPASVVTRR